MREEDGIDGLIEMYDDLGEWLDMESTDDAFAPCCMVVILTLFAAIVAGVLLALYSLIRFLIGG